jgi:hypothetical protein
MKKILFAASMLIAVSQINAQAVNQNAVKLNPLSLAFATGNVSYERAVMQTSLSNLVYFILPLISAD